LNPDHFFACVAVVHCVTPASHVRLAAIQILATTFLTEVEGILPEETMAVGGTMAFGRTGTCASNSPPVSSISTLVPEKNPCMTAALKHLKSHKMPATAELLGGFPIAPTMGTIVVDREAIVNPQLASIIRDKLEVVTA
jgi:hypothetical protein